MSGRITLGDIVSYSAFEEDGKLLREATGMALSFYNEDWRVDQGEVHRFGYGRRYHQQLFRQRWGAPKLPCSFVGSIYDDDERSMALEA